MPSIDRREEMKPSDTEGVVRLIADDLVEMAEARKKTLLSDALNMHREAYITAEPPTDISTIRKITRLVLQTAADNRNKPLSGVEIINQLVAVQRQPYKPGDVAAVIPSLEDLRLLVPDERITEFGLLPSGEGEIVLAGLRHQRE